MKAQNIMGNYLKGILISPYMISNFYLKRRNVVNKLEKSGGVKYQTYLIKIITNY